MSLKNKFGSVVATISVATLLSTALTSCQKDQQVAPVSKTEVASNSMAVVNTTSSLATTYTGSSALSYYGKSNFTISGLSISGGTYCIYLNNCSNVTITNCRLANGAKYEVYMTNNCKNVTMTNCYVTGGVSGVHVENSSTIKINSNQFQNINGPYPGGNFVQFVNVSGGGCQINNNHCEDIAGIAQHPQDGLSVYKSNGLQGDSIQVIGNWIRGGQYQNDSGGAAAIVLGDVGGSYQVARNNIIVNGGFVGMQVQGGAHIKMDHNTISGGVTPYSNCGLCYGNYSGQASWDVNISYNKVRYYKTNGQEMDMWVDTRTASIPTGWSTNIGRAAISSAVLPLTIITLN